MKPLPISKHCPACGSRKFEAVLENRANRFEGEKHRVCSDCGTKYHRPPSAGFAVMVCLFGVLLTVGVPGYFGWRDKADDAGSGLLEASWAAARENWWLPAIGAGVFVLGLVILGVRHLTMSLSRRFLEPTLPKSSSAAAKKEQLPTAEPAPSTSEDQLAPMEVQKFWEIDLSHLTLAGWSLILCSLIATGLIFVLVMLVAFALSMAVGLPRLSTRAGLAAFALAGALGLGLGSWIFRSGWRWLEHRGTCVLRRA